MQSLISNLRHCKTGDIISIVIKYFLIHYSLFYLWYNILIHSLRKECIHSIIYYTMYTVHCTLYNVQCIVYILHRIVYSVQSYCFLRNIIFKILNHHDNIKRYIKLNIIHKPVCIFNIDMQIKWFPINRNKNLLHIIIIDWSSIIHYI